ncbi:MAG: outer membrane beta-barrel protein [Afipia sp.]
MKSAVALIVLEEIGSCERAAAPLPRRGSKFARLGRAQFSATALMLLVATPSNAQVIPSSTEQLSAPWNAQRVFEPSSPPDLTDSETRSEIQPEDIPVRKRQQPGYEPVGIRAGSWIFSPKLMSGTLYDSNVFSSNTSKRADIAAVIEPSLRAHTLWERHGLDLSLNAQSTIYKENSSLNQTNASLKGNGWFDIAHDLAVLANFQIAHLNEGVGTLSSPVNAVSPTPYDLFSGDLTVRKEFNRLSTSVGMRVDSYNYGQTRAQNGSIINQDGRDGQIYSLHGRVDYAFSPVLGWFAGVEGNQRNIRGTPTQPLNSEGYRALTGFTVGFTNLLSGEFGAGYVQQRFDASSIGTIEGPSYRAMLTWRPTRLLDVHFKAEQIVTETSDTSSTGVLANAFQLGLDYELRRNVIISLAGGYENDSFFGQPRKDKVITSDARIKYLINRYGSISVFHRYTDRNSDTPAFSFEKHQVGINVTAQF